MRDKTCSFSHSPRNQLTTERDTFKTCALCEYRKSSIIYFKHIFFVGGGGGGNRDGGLIKFNPDDGISSP